MEITPGWSAPRGSLERRGSARYCAVCSAAMRCSTTCTSAARQVAPDRDRERPARDVAAEPREQRADAGVEQRLAGLQRQQRDEDEADEAGPGLGLADLALRARVRGQPGPQVGRRGRLGGGPLVLRGGHRLPSYRRRCEAVEPRSALASSSATAGRTAGTPLAVWPT
jgi:hypothetical protein